MKICILLICLVFMSNPLGMETTLSGAEANKWSCTKEDGQDYMICSYRFGNPPDITDPAMEEEEEEEEEVGFSPFEEGAAAAGGCKRKVKHEDVEAFYPLVGRGKEVKLMWEADEDETYLYFFVVMPGLSKEDLKISVEQNTMLVIHGEGDEHSPDAHGCRRTYHLRFHLPESLFNLKASGGYMENGVLRYLVTKVKGRNTNKDVFEIKII